MDGTLPNNMHKEIIQSWMDTVIGDGGIDRYDDLHVDRIDPTWKKRRFWVPAALDSYEIAVSIRDARKYDLTVVLAFSLEPDEHPRGRDFHGIQELEANFHATPPSLYLFRPGTEFWMQRTAYVATEEIDWVTLFGPIPRVKKCIYMEVKRPSSDEYSRSLLIAG